MQRLEFVNGPLVELTSYALEQLHPYDIVKTTDPEDATAEPTEYVYQVGITSNRSVAYLFYVEE